MGEVEKKCFTALPGKGGHSGLVPSKLCVPAWRGSEEFYSNGSERACSARGHAPDWLVGRQESASSTFWFQPVWGLVLVDSTPLTSPTWWGFQYLQSSSEILCIPCWKQDPAPRLHYCFLTAPPLSLHPLPSLISTCLNCPSELKEGHGG